MKIKEAKTFFQKLKGLMFKRDIDYILKIKTNGVHTFFMKINIDIYLTDKNDTIIYIYKNIKPGKIIFPKRNVKYTYETKANYLKNVKIGEKFIPS
ncbi:MAG: DUF192 domain-containing protein [Bacilli bacterium]|nr:DUF192 domain-containing protein [Bacilli bacterium]